MTLPNSHLSFEFSLTGDHPILANHHVHGRPLVPGVTWLGLIMEALTAEGFTPSDFVLEDIVFREALALGPNEQATLRVFVDASDHAVTIVNVQDEVEHCRCRLVLASDAGAPIPVPSIPSLGAMIARPMAGVYENARGLDIVHGDWMRGRGTAYLGDNIVVADVALGDVAGSAGFALHPALMDCATVTPFAAGGFSLDHRTPAIPLAIGRLRVFGTGFTRARMICTQSESAVSNSDIMHNDLWLLDDTGAPLVQIERLSAKRIRSSETLSQATQAPAQNASIAAPSDVSLEEQLANFIQGATGRDVSDKIELGFYELGFDSSDLLSLASSLENQINQQFYPTLFYEHSSIPKLAKWLQDNGVQSLGITPHLETVEAPETASWLHQFIAEATGISKDFSPDTPFYDLGLDSAALLSLSQTLEEALGATFYPTMCYEHGSVAALAAYFDDLGLAPKGATATESTRNERKALAKSAVETWIDTPLVKTSHVAETWAAYAPSEVLGAWPVWNGNDTIDGLMWDIPKGQDPAQTLSAALNMAQSMSRQTAPTRLIVLAHDTDAAAVVPFLRSLIREMPRVTGRVISGVIPNLSSELEAGATGIERVRYHAGMRQSVTLQTCPAPAMQAPKFDGAVVLTGGTGGIAQSLVQSLFDNGHRTFSLIARGAPSPELQVKLADLTANGCEIQTLRADVTKLSELTTAWRKIKARFGSVSGIVHCAGILRDGLIQGKKITDAQAVLNVKLDALRALDDLSADEPLAFFAACGSVTGVFGNIGQSDYAFANGAMAGYLERRSADVAKNGVNICFDWPFWAEGGMDLDEKRLSQLARETGMEPLATSDATAAFISAIGAVDHGHRCMPLMVSDAPQFENFIAGLGLPKASVSVQSTTDTTSTEPMQIAVIGLAGEYPGARNLDAFWDNLVDGVDGITPVPADRWDHAALLSQDRGERGKVYTKEGGFIADHDRFDAEFFNVPPREARILDPQERRFLQTAWTAVESAGCNPRRMAERDVGVFVGAMWGQYQLNGQDKDGSVAASIFSAIANRVSYSFNFTGPSMAVDSMCSSSLTAVHLAMESLARGECTMAIAGGVNLMTHPHKFQFLCQNQMLSEDSRCRSFGEGGGGYVPGEGVGAIVLKPLKQALLDGDPVQAVFLASAINHGGRAAGMTVPNPDAQAEVVRAAHIKAGTLNKISYIEAHGTGTSLGDPIEISGLRKAFDGAEIDACAIGSVKSNIGHLEGAAGIASITKTVLQLRNNYVVPSLHAEQLNPKLGIENTPFSVQTTGAEWAGPDRVAGISAFGAGGSNAHLVIGSAPVLENTTLAKTPAVIAISARDDETLTTYVADWIRYLHRPQTQALPFAAIAATSVSGREAFEHRIAVVCETAIEAEHLLDQWLMGAQDVRVLVVEGAGNTATLTSAHAFADGKQIDPTPAYTGRVEIPTYPFGGAKYAMEPQPVVKSEGASPMLGATELRPDGVRFVTEWGATEPLFSDHTIAGAALMPAALMLETIHSALTETGCGHFAIEAAKIGTPVVVDTIAKLECQVFQHGTAVAGEIAHADTGAIVMQTTAQDPKPSVSIPSCPLQSGADIGNLYDQFAEQGLTYGPHFRCLTHSQTDETGTWVNLELPQDAGWRRSAIAIDAAMQAVVLTGGDITEDRQTWLPSDFKNVLWLGDPANAVWAHVQPKDVSEGRRSYQISLVDDHGTVLWQASEFTLRPRARVTTEITPTVAVVPVENIQDKLRDQLADLLAEESGLAADKVRRVDGFTELGVDSVMVMNMTFKLEQAFGPLPKSMFFERTGIADLSRWLVNEHAEAAQKFVGVIPTAAPVGKPTKHTPAPLLKSLRATGGAAKTSGAEPLAIIGMAGRFPDADDVDGLWKNLSTGHNAVTKIPEDRWPAHLFQNADGRKGDACGFGAFIDDVYGFDADFFGMTPIDAKRADPAERLILETAWGAAENAGYSRKALKGRSVGVFVASMWQQYQHYGVDAALRGEQMSAVSLLSSTASRISGMLGVTGPCIALDTMCSGSLTALHLARQAIANGDCEAAVVGGVNLSLHPHKYLTLSAGGFLSKKGQCASFGADADGYVPGEGAGAVLVKPLSRALADGDPVHGVILGTAVNHIGGTNGTTVPSATAQSDVIQSAISNAGIDASKISYVECHGTGTALGDPIELEGLEAALSANVPHDGCHIGSIKSNMGHAEAAAGVIGMIKVLLQFKHEQLAPTLHIEEVNPALDLETTPFTLVDELQDWNVGDDKFATVSAFGAGGSNANVVLQSPPTRDVAPQTAADHLFLFSATTEPTLAAQLRKTMDWMDATPDTTADIVSATLALGREDQQHRLAIVAGSLGELRDRMTAFLAGKPSTRGTYSSSTQNNERLSDFFDDAEGRNMVQALLMQRRLGKLAQFWAGGIDIDWSELFVEGQQRASMPGSVFDRQPLMFDTGLEAYAVQFDNTSDLSEQSYHVEIPAGHPVIADHVIDGKKQVSLALMTRIIHEALVRADDETDWTISLGVERPWFVQDRLTCDVRMTPSRRGLDVTLEADGSVIAKGNASQQTTIPAAIEFMCEGHSAGATFYDEFDRDGYAYGPQYNAVRNFDIVDDTVVATLNPNTMTDPFGLDRLAVGALDAPLQLSRPVLERASSAGWLPVNVSLSVVADAGSAVRVVTRVASQSEADAKFDIQWQNETGQVVAFATATLAARPDTIELERTFTVERNWGAVSVPTIATLDASYIAIGGVVGNAPVVDDLTAALDQNTGDTLQVVVQGHEAQELSILEVWSFVRAVRTAGVETLSMVFLAPSVTPHIMGLTSWLRALSEEIPTVSGRILVSDISPADADIASAAAQDSVLLRKTQTGWEKPTISEQTPTDETDFCVKDQVVAITGGAGGLGRVLARHLARKGAHPILIGRRPANESTQSCVAALRQIGAEAVYYDADIADPAQAESLARRIKLRFGRVDGVIHAAGVTSDAWLMDQTEDSVKSVLAPKVDGTDQLIDLMGQFAPKWCVSFGSISGFLGNPGQTDYSYANAYMDAALATRMGDDCRVINLSWPLWKDIGMQVDPKMLDIMDKRFGMQPLPVATGLAAFDRALGGNAGNYLITFGAPDRIAKWLDTKETGLTLRTPEVAVQAPVTATPVITQDIAAPVSADIIARKWVADAVHSETQITADKLDWNKSIDQFGISSVMSTSIVAFLEQQCGASLPATLMFECQTWGEVAQWLIDNGHAKSNAAVQAQAPAAETPPPETTSKPKSRKKSKTSRFARAVPEVAIVGAACRMPQADNMDAFWDILENGRDVVSSIPSERWDWSNFADAKDTASMKGGFLNNVKRFDYPFFGIFHKEARSMDPQERLVLETSWHALEDAGIAPSTLSDKSVGVYMGAMWTQYQMLARELWDQAPAEAAANGSASAIANRLSFLLNLAGPSLTLDTMCSSSLMAMKLATDALRSGEIDMAIVGGVNTTLHPFKYHQLQSAQFLSPEGRCGAFGEGGDGYVPAEGVGVVVLRREEDAERSGDRIRARVKGIGVSHGGRANGFTVPRPQKQAAAITAALADGDIDPKTVSYVEAHGTGTALGDPIEMTGLKSSYFSDGDFPLRIGSVKANMGHAESAAGMASMCKVLLQFEHGKLAPSIYADPPNPDLGIDGTGLVVQQTLDDWTPASDDQSIRRAGISGFGAGGTNVHVILEDVDAVPSFPEVGHDVEIIVLSARDKKRLKHVARAMHDWNSDTTLGAIAAASQLGREAHKARLAIAATDVDDLRQKLDCWLRGEQSADLWTGSVDIPSVYATEDRDLVRPRDARALAQAWAEGASVEWAALWPQDTPRARLPQYPFEELNVWLGDDAGIDPITAMITKSGPTTARPAIAASAPIKIAQEVVAVSTIDVTGVLIELLCETFKLEEDDLSLDMTFDRIGMDSVAATDCAAKLSKSMGHDVDATWFFNHPTIRQLAAALEEVAPVDVPVAQSPDEVKHPIKSDEPIAIVGISGAFAGAPDLQTYWSNLAAGTDSVTEVNAARWDIDAHHSSDPQEAGKTVSRRMGQMQDIDVFDPAAFNLMPDEVEAMDPQQRLFMKHAAIALDNAALAPEHIDGVDCGVFAGTMTGTYRAFLEENGDGFTALSMLGNHAAALPARVAFWLNLTGPTLAVDTACSSSLVSVHLACQAIRNGECSMALAGGVFVSPGPQEMISSSQAGMLSPSGSCKTFDDDADGIALGEGAGVLVLKPLSEAIAQGDPIHAVLRASGINQDGRTNGLTAPNALSQARLVTDVHAKAGITPNDIDYVECHGTGTRLGDPVEIEGLKRSLGNERDVPLMIGSVKPNVGHCYAAAGVASLLKVILSLKNGALPPSIHCNTPNQLIDFSSANMTVNTELRDWTKSDGPRIAAVSAFGYSGTNAHLVVEEAPQNSAVHAANEVPVVLPISARKPKLVVAQAKALAAALSENKVPLATLAHTLQKGRRIEACRAVCVVDTIDDAIKALAAITEADVKRVRDQKAAPVAGDAQTLATAWMDGTPRQWPSHPHSQRASVPGKCFDEKRIWPATNAAEVTPMVTPTEPDTNGSEYAPLLAPETAADVSPTASQLKRITSTEFGLAG